MNHPKTIAFIVFFIPVIILTGCNSESKKRAKLVDSLIVNETKIPVKPSADVITGIKIETISNDEAEGSRKTEIHKLTGQFEKIVAFDPNAPALYPSSLIQGVGLPDGLLNPVTTKRNPTIITINDLYQNGKYSVSRLVPDPSNASVTDSIGSILKQATKSAIAANVTYSIQKIYSLEQAFMNLQASYKWATGSITGALSSSRSEEYSKFLVRFVERYFTVSCKPPSYPTSFIHKDGYKDLLNYISDKQGDTKKNPLCYISSVSYGRELWVLVESKLASDSLEIALNAAFGGLNTGGKIHMDSKTTKILNEAIMQGYIVGGSRKKAGEYIGNSNKNASGLAEFIGEGDDFDILGDVPKPISYTVSYLRDNSPARISPTTDYQINTSNIKTKSPLVSAVVHFNNGDDGKDQTTGLRVYLFDNRTLGKNFIAGLNKATPDITSQVAYADLLDNKQGQSFPDNSSIDFPLGNTSTTNSDYLEDGVLFIWIFPHGRDRWQFTPSLHLKFKNAQYDKDIPLRSVDLSHTNGFIAIPFSLK